MNPVMVVRHQVHGTTGESLGRGLWLWCPACNTAHRPVIPDEDGTRPPGPVWGWDGNLEAPTIEGSYLVHEVPGHNPRCHSYIRNGHWEFLSDSTHDLAGQTVPLVPLPDWLVR